jgi:hypothetical protein
LRPTTIRFQVSRKYQEQVPWKIRWTRWVIPWIAIMWETSTLPSKHPHILLFLCPFWNEKYPIGLLVIPRCQPLDWIRNNFQCRKSPLHSWSRVAHAFHPWQKELIEIEREFHSYLVFKLLKSNRIWTCVTKRL